MSAGSTAIATPPPTARSAVSNGSRLVTGVDMRTSLGRRTKDLFRAFRAALDADTIDDVMVARLKTAAETRAIVEEVRARFLRGEVVSLEDIVRLENQAARAERALALPKRVVGHDTNTDGPGSRILALLRRDREAIA